MRGGACVRRAVGVLVILGVLLTVLLLALPTGLPELSNAEKTLAVTEDQTVYLTESTSGSSWIYGVKDDGSVQKAYAQDSSFRITLLSAYGNDVYFVQTPQLTEEGWQLLCLREDGTTELLYEETGDFPVSPEAVSVSPSGIDLTFLTDEKVSVYRMELSGGEPVQLLETELAEGEIAVSAVFAEDRLFCLFSDGRVRSSRTGEQNSETLQEAEGFTLLSASQGSVWAYRQETGTACSGSIGIQNGSGVEVNGQAVLYGGRGGAKGQTVVVSVENGSTVLLRIGDADVRRQTPEASFLVRMQFKASGLIFLLTTYAVCAALILFTVFLCTRMHRLAVRVTACCICLLLVAAGVSGTISWVDAQGQSGQLLETQAASAGKIREDILEELDLTSILAGNADQAELRRLIAPLEMETEEQYVSFRASVLTAEGDTVQISDRAAAGSPVASVYGEEVRALAQSAVTQDMAMQQSLECGGKTCAYDIRPLYRYGEKVGMLVSQVVLVRTDYANMLGRSFLPPFWSALLASVAVAFLTFTMMRPLRRLASRVSRISEGDFNLVPLRTASDEVGDMWQSLREMSVSLRIKDYETNATVHSFYRFVPRGLDRLLNRASIMETSLGDMANVTGTVGILSIQNRDELRAGLDDSGFLGFLSDSYSLIDHQMERHEGTLLSSGFDPEGMEILFQKSPNQGVAFSLGLLGESNGMAREQAPDFFLLLHSTSFLYGLVGTEQRTFSLLSSSEIAFLHSFSKHFKGTGVRVAATEACLKAMTQPCASRYIGFVSSEDGKYRYKLHQILEGCSDLEKSMYLSYDEKFQKGISLFCQNDFYLARNLFAAILELNPSDGIARWYLFACEHYFNQNDPGSEGYNLFGIQG